jgi:molecular chaperone GrpE
VGQPDRPPGQGDQPPGAEDAAASPAAPASSAAPAAPGPQAEPGAADAPGQVPPDTAESIAELQARAAVLEQEWRRALADADNLRKRFARDAERIRAQERAEVARRFLPVIDDLDRALEHAQGDAGGIVDGVRAVRDEAVRVLADLGFPRRDDTGERFDPARHEAVGAVPAGDAPPGTVVQVVRPGYGSGEQQLRPALVVVAKES